MHVSLLCLRYSLKKARYIIAEAWLRPAQHDCVVLAGYEVISDPTYGTVHRFNNRDLSLTPTEDQTLVLDEFYRPSKGLLEQATKQHAPQQKSAHALPRREVLTE